MHEVAWGLPVVSYLFLAGLGAGALTVSASILLRGHGGEFGGDHFTVARYGALIAPFPVLLGCFLLLAELGSFQTGHWFKWLNLYRTINLSPMSIGTWLLTCLIIVSLVYAYSFWPRSPQAVDRYDFLRKGTAWIGIPLGIGVAVYTGVLLGSMPSRPFWNSPVLALLFLLSALSTGIAVTMLTRTILGKRTFDTARDVQRNRQSGYLLTATDLIFIGFELLAIFLFLVYAYLSVGDVRYAVSVVLFGGGYAFVFWFGVVVVGLLLPAIIELVYVTPTLLFQKPFSPPRWIEWVVPIAVLCGGFLLRYVIVIAGQITGPIGI